MVFQFILAGILLLVVIVYFAVVYWQITLTIIGVIVFLWWLSKRRKQHNSDDQYEYVEPEGYEKWFEILHLDKTATWNDVKEQYRKFAHMYHPDKTCIGKKQSEEKFILVTMAKDALEEEFRLKNKKHSGPEVM